MSIELEVILNNSESFETFDRAVKEGVSLLRQVDELKDKLKEIGQYLKEELDIATKDFNQVIKHVHKDEIDEELEYLSTTEFAVNKIKGNNNDNDDCNS